jgi:signal transduction histidine kinase
MSLFDNPATIPTLSAFGGSVIGALSSTVSAWIRQRQQERRELVANKVAQLEQLYSDFINESARLLVDAVQHSLEDASTLVPIYALISRIRLRSSTEVIESGERLIATILKVYIEPNLTPEEIQAAASKHNDHLQEFSIACRRELESLV